MQNNIELLIKKTYSAWKRRQRGFSGACPGEESLVLLSQGLVVGKEAARLRAHIVRCPLCAEYLAMSIRVSAFAEEDVPQGLLAMVKESIGRDGFVMDVVIHIVGAVLEIVHTTGEIIRCGGSAPAGAFRGKKSSEYKEIMIREDFHSLQMELTIENKGKGAFNLIVCARKKERIFRSLRYTLMKDGVELESYRTDNGKAVFENVVSGFYVIYLTLNARTVSKITLHVKQ